MPTRVGDAHSPRVARFVRLRRRSLASPVVRETARRLLTKDENVNPECKCYSAIDRAQILLADLADDELTRIEPNTPQTFERHRHRQITFGPNLFRRAAKWGRCQARVIGTRNTWACRAEGNDRDQASANHVRRTHDDYRARLAYLRRDRSAKIADQDHARLEVDID